MPEARAERENRHSTSEPEARAERENRHSTSEPEARAQRENPHSTGEAEARAQRAGRPRRGSPPPTDVPAKLYYRIGEVAELVGVEPHVLRYWEREFRSIRPTKSARGQRVYSRRDVETLMRVRELLYDQGFTIAGAKKKLGGGSDGERETAQAAPSSNPAAGDGFASERARERAREVRAELLGMRAEIAAFLAELEG